MNLIKSLKSLFCKEPIKKYEPKDIFKPYIEKQTKLLEDFYSNTKEESLDEKMIRLHSRKKTFMQDYIR